MRPEDGARYGQKGSL